MGKPRTICPTYWFGDVVYLRVDVDGTPGMVTRLVVLPNDTYVYTISWPEATDSGHYDFELSSTPSYTKPHSNPAGDVATEE